MLAYSGKGRFVVEPVDLSVLVREFEQMLCASVTKGVVLKFYLTRQLPPVEADASQMKQLLMNLVTNASEAIGARSGVVSISTGVMYCDREYLREVFLDEGLPEGRYVFLEVADTGPGFDAETRAKLFDPFFTTKFAGRGLGLAAVLGIVRGHRGAIKVYSEPGRGSTFKVLLPAADEDEVAAREAREHVEPARRSGLILLADDEEEVRRVGRRMLQKLGFDVLLAADGREALAIFDQHAARIVAVVLDLTMPHLDGEEAFRELRRRKADVRVILSSGYNEQDVTQRFVGKGLAGFIQKPYQMAKLRATLMEVLGPRIAIVSEIGPEPPPEGGAP
jgi:CheY-like chemotaxis protein